MCVVCRNLNPSPCGFYLYNSIGFSLDCVCVSRIQMHSGNMISVKGPLTSDAGTWYVISRPDLELHKRQL